MVFSHTAPRRAYHQRKIDCMGYFREDGMWDIEGHMRDEKTYSFENEDRGTVEVGDAIHDMWLRLTVDTNFVIRDAEAKTLKSPFDICPQAQFPYRNLIGLTIGAGFRKEVKRVLESQASCTHLTELIWTLATVAFQSIYGSSNQVKKDQHLNGGDEGYLKTTDGDIVQTRPPHLNSCYALNETSPVVKRYWPNFYIDPEQS